MRYIKSILHKNRMWTALYIGLGVFNSFMVNYKAACFQKVIDGLAERNLALSGILIYGLILAILYSMNYVDNYPDQKLQHGIYLDFKLLALQKISRIDYLEYHRHGTGKLVQKIENGAQAGKNVLFGFWLTLIRELLPTIAFSVFFIWRISRPVTCALLAGYGIIFVVTNILLKFLYQIKERILNNEELLNHYLVRGFMEMPVFRMHRQFPAEIRKAEEAKKEIVSSKVKMTMIHEAFFTIFVLLVTLLDVCILLYAWREMSLSVGSVAALLSLIENAYMPIAIFNVLYVQYRLDRAAYARFEAFLDSRDDERLALGISPGDGIGELCIRNLSFQYEGREILCQVSLSVKDGEKVALVGESGSGKSTLIRLITGLLKYGTGQILLGGQELKELCLDKLYDRICYFSQDTPVFDGSLRENVVFDRSVPDRQILDALRSVQLSCLTEGAGMGLDMQIGEKGTCLSGGEKQRLALARLWFTDPELVILDEATSAMDNLTEEAVMGAVLGRLRDKTVLAIAHRLSSIADFDRILVFRDGRIVSQGTFEELMEKDPYFARLYHASLQQIQ